MFKNFEIAVDTIKSIRNRAITVNTNDLQTIKFTLTITQSGEPIFLTGSIVRLAIKKPDEKTVFQDCTILDGGNGKCEIILDKQAYIVPGLHLVEVMIYYSADRISVTSMFSYTAVKGILAVGASESTNEFQSINQAMSDVDGIVVDLQNKGTGIDTQAQSDLETQAFQLSETMKEGISCKVLGMIQNDISKAVSNFELLSQAILENKKVLIDGVYYISPLVFPVKASNIIISITGSTVDAELKLTGKNVATYFKVFSNTNIYIKRVKITNSEEAEKIIFIFDKRAYISKFHTLENEFYGNIRFVESVGDMNINPQNVKFGIKEFVFSDNYTFNNKNAFIKFSNVPGDKFLLERNTVRNFNYTFFKNSITNGGPYTSEFLKETKSHVLKDNIVVCDDSWYGATGSGSYYCFSLFEGDTVVYEGNHVEGLKATDSIALYDVYFSCRDLKYINNTWKNNICFFSDKTYNALLKSKGGPEGEIIRHYEGNRFIIEKEFVERLSRNLEDAWVDFISLTSYAKEYRIINNYIDVYELRFSESSLDCDTWIIENNTFKAQIMKNTVLAYRSKSGIDYTNKQSSLRYNKIISQEGLINLVRGWDYSSMTNLFPFLLIEGNTVNGPVNYAMYTVSADRVVFKDNIINATRQRNAVDYSAGLSYGLDSKINEFLSTNNIFNSYRYFFQPRNTRGFQKTTEEHLFMKIPTTENDGIILKTDAKESKLLRYFVEYDILLKTGWEKLNFTFDYGYDPVLDKNFVEFRDTTDALVRYALPAGSIGEGDGKKIKTNTNNITNSSIQVQFANKPANKSIWVSNMGNEKLTIKQKINAIFIN
ncbi:phage baseplate upper protein [Peribacillus frigoritolerans]|uniref:phage baseplate upper protein n=1 Tax=Peribacillus frigoritolerans TaxID=450367 RepID=UPI0021621EFB|nr:phage baseplate upper protein [Peribacillus frigoritolerans]